MSEKNLPSNLTSNFREASNFLELHKIDSVLSDKWDHFHFQTGSELATIKSYVLPFIIPLWASALSRPMDDQLVPEPPEKDGDQT
ncbi:MAG: hypothetical protein AAB656_02175 [Patescibacteria group bacterium]